MTHVCRGRNPGTWNSPKTAREVWKSAPPLPLTVRRRHGIHVIIAALLTNVEPCLCTSQGATVLCQLPFTLLQLRYP